MNDTPLISILINNYNYEKFLPECIDSVLKQTYPHIEVIVVDDGSKDNSREVVSSYGNQLVSVFKKNGGQASAFNAGFAASKGEIICFLDADDYYRTDKVNYIVELFKQNPNISWVFHHLEDVDINGHSLGLERNQGVCELSLINLQEEMLKGGKLPYFPATSGLCFKREILERVLPMPEQISISADNFLRLGAVCMSPGLLSPNKVAVHRIHGSNLFEFRKDYEYVNGETNIKTCYYLRKYFPETRFYTNRLFAHAVGRMAGKTSLTKVFQIPEFKEYIKNYFSWEFGLTGGSRILYNYIKVILANNTLTENKSR